MGYLGEGEGVGHGADEDLTQFPIEVGALNAVQVGIHPEDPGEREFRSWSRSYLLLSSDLIYTDSNFINQIKRQKVLSTSCRLLSGKYTHLI